MNTISAGKQKSNIFHTLKWIFLTDFTLSVLTLVKDLVGDSTRVRNVWSMHIIGCMTPNN